MGILDEYKQHNNQKSWKSFFDHILQASYGRHESSAKDARRSKFRSRNRYADVSPYDHSRVRLVRNGIDYINASMVVVPDADRSYILTQGPLKETAGHFWLMVWEQNSRAIIMLNRVIEKEQVKCYQYFPVGQDNEGDDEMIFNDVGLKVTYVTEKHTNYHFTTRVFQLTDLESSESREVLQFHYTAWPDFGVPESPGAFLDFLFTVRENSVLDNPNAPPVIHCSAGIGRSGTICLVDTCLVLARKNGGDLNSVKVVDILLDMRRYRMGLIQTADQLRFSYLAIIEGAKRLFEDNSSFENANVVEGTVDNGQSDELDAINSIDSVIDSFDDLDNNHDPIKPRSVAQARLESLFVQPDNNFKTSKEETPHIPSDASHVSQVSTTTIKEAESRSNPNSNVTVTERVAEDNIESFSRKSVAVDSNHEQSAKLEAKRARDERVKNTSEKIARIKQRMRENEEQRQGLHRYQPYAVAAISVAVAVVGYLTYQYMV